MPINNSTPANNGTANGEVPPHEMPVDYLMDDGMDDNPFHTNVYHDYPPTNYTGYDAPYPLAPVYSYAGPHSLHNPWYNVYPYPRQGTGYAPPNRSVQYPPHGMCPVRYHHQYRPHNTGGPSHAPKATGPLRASNSAACRQRAPNVAGPSRDPNVASSSRVPGHGQGFVPPFEGQYWNMQGQGYDEQDDELLP
ncbi:hypothetical protein C0993_011832 [Termitomyces sp. T159_Od127]|nr:hypothetical protein C0993_011832 [Termitomyces sp. T159_Od127]